MSRANRNFVPLGVSLIALALGAGSGGCGTTVGNPMVALEIQGTAPGTLSAPIAFPSLARLTAPLYGPVSALASPRRDSILSAASAATIEVEVSDANGDPIGTLTLDTARLALEEITIETDDSETKDPDFPGPYIVNLVTNTVEPALGTIQLPAGTYKQIQLKLAKTEDGDVPSSDDLFKRSIYVEGTYSGEAGGSTRTDIPFTMAFDLDEEFQLTPTGGTSAGISLAAGENATIIVAFRLNRWLRFNDGETNSDGLDFDNLSVGGGEIVLDEDASGDDEKIREVIKENIKISADYGKDANGDGELESSEDDDSDPHDEGDD